MPTPLHRRTMLAGAAALAAGPLLAQGDAPMIAAASDLQFAVEALAAGFAAQTGQSVRLSLGSTGNMARQIRAGAPFQMFMAADEQFILDLARDGFTQDEGSLYGLGRIVLKVPQGSPLEPDGSLEGLRQALAARRIGRFAIANPDHAPYGMRAREALIHKGLWDAVRPFLVLGENVSQAAQFALSGNAEGGIIALSLALAPDLARRGAFGLIPADHHQPMWQRMALLRGAGPVATAFFAHVASPEGRAVLATYGFALPEE
ncbi:MAG TPA: molybdate ABC transporter substrate-binding protein [Paracoccaceae bacterium]|nr:molybdate ABC transporter substrate-binding protein [Paracoccaceae bacterium]